MGKMKIRPNYQTALHRVGAIALTLALGCLSNGEPDGKTDDPPVEILWQRLQALCGQAFPGSAIEVPPGDTTMSGRELIIHLRECSPDEIRIPFQISGDRSRTWILRRTPDGLELKHQHRHPDGSLDSITNYGGRTLPGAIVGPVTAQFPADSETIRLLPEAASNIWTIEVESGRALAYSMVRQGTSRRFRLEFNLQRPVPLPPNPW